MISSTFMAWLRSDSPHADLTNLVAPGDIEPLSDRRHSLAELLAASLTFSWETANLQGPDEEVLLALRERGDLGGGRFSPTSGRSCSHIHGHCRSCIIPSTRSATQVRLSLSTGDVCEKRW